MAQVFDQLFNYDNYKKSTCKRWGLKVDQFSNVLGVIMLQGTIYYDSSKNYRSNKTFDEFKRTNKISKSALVYIVQGNPEFIMEGLGQDNMDKLMEMYDKNPDCIIYGRGCTNFKFQRSKVFYLKFNDALYSDGETNYLVDNATLECECNFKN